VVRLTHHCYVDDHRYCPITRISKLCDYSKSNPEVDIPRATSDPLPEDTEMKRVLDFVQGYLQGAGVLKADQYERNCDLLHVLELFLTTLRQGFWQNTNQLKTMITYILKIL
jgi:hypothetical protein